MNASETDFLRLSHLVQHNGGDGGGGVADCVLVFQHYYDY
jgi:hypothetical protein